MGVVSVLRERRNDERKLSVTFWRDAVSAGKTTIENLLDALDTFDFAVLVLSSDDTVDIRGVRTLAPRDNVVFETGLFTGRIGRERTFIILPDDPEVRIPTDLLGVNVLTYARDSSDPTSEVRDAAYKASKAMLNSGPRPTTAISSDSPFRECAQRRDLTSMSSGTRYGRGKPLAGAARADDGNQRKEPEGAEAFAESSPPLPSWLDLARAGLLLSVEPSFLSYGNYVVHGKWGLGMVLEIGPDINIGRLVVVSFHPHGEGEVRASDLYLAKLIDG